MLTLHGAPSRADSFLQKLRDYVDNLLDHDFPAAQILDAAASEARRLLPAIDKQDGERIADFIVEEVCEARYKERGRIPRKPDGSATAADETNGCRIIAFPQRVGSDSE